MNATRWARGALAPLLAVALLVSIASPATPREHHASKGSSSCHQPCTHVEDCPKVTCECAHGTASGVAVCDTEKTHCCGSASLACKRFCEVNHQKWAGRFTPEASPQDSGAASTDADSSASAAPCPEPCQQAEDCRTVSCQCVHGTVTDVAACDGKAHCCGSSRVVCEHFCGAKKDKWTGKVVEATQPHDEGSGLDEPSNDGADPLEP